jgi:hypothetical protein
VSRPHPFALLAALALASLACQDPVDKAAKQRIFSPEDPPKVVASAAEPLPAESLAEDGRVARRVLGMEAAEVTERLGPHRYQASVSFEWAGGEGSSPVKLTEDRTLVAGPGGVAGDFSGSLKNSRDQGLDVIRVDSKVYARSRYGKFRQRLRDRGMAERTRLELTGALRDVDRLFSGRLRLTSEGSATYEGRTTWRYRVSLAPESSQGTAPASGTEALPPLLEPKGGRDETTRRRAAFLARRTPRSLSGEVWVDARNSVVLKARLDGRLGVPATEEGGAAELRMTAEVTLSEIGQDPRLQPPKEFLPDADKPEGLADALDRFGIARQRTEDGGTPAPEPEDEESSP